VVIPFHGAPQVRLPSSWAGNERGGLAFLTLLPAQAVFVCPAVEGGSFRFRQIDKKLALVLKSTRWLRRLAIIAFLALFVIAPLVAWQLGFTQIGLVLIAAFLIFNVIIAVVFFRSHRRVQPTARSHRWAHAVVMLVATPSAIRAVDQVSRDLLGGFDPLAVAVRLAGDDDPAVKRMFRELAHPEGGAAPGKRYEAALAAGLRHDEELPEASEGASSYCPRCLAQFQAGPEECIDCGLPLVPLVTSSPVHGPRRRSRP